MTDIRQSMCQVHDASFDPAHTNVTPYTYELPDGNTIEFGIERIALPEALFSNDLPVCSFLVLVLTMSLRNLQSEILGVRV